MPQESERSPELYSRAFDCPHCGAFADQEWHDLTAPAKDHPGAIVLDGFATACCNSCEDWSIWRDAKLVHPALSTAPRPARDLPKSILPIYEEARQVFPVSSAAAAALLRLAIEKLCAQHEPEGTLNEKIGRLVKSGLAPRYQRALDAVRVIGNSMVHPGNIDLADQADAALSLFTLVNRLTDHLISEPREIDGIYDRKIPRGQKEQIARRDGK